MPKITEIKEVDGQIWVCVGKPSDSSIGVAVVSMGLQRKQEDAMQEALEALKEYACVDVNGKCWADSINRDGQAFCHNEIRGRECGKIARLAITKLQEALDEKDV